MPYSFPRFPRTGPPTTNRDSGGIHYHSHPAKPLLILMGIYGLLLGGMGVPVGLFVGPHVLSSAVTLLAFGSMALWLGYRQYDRFGRNCTITWAGLAVLLILFATLLQPPPIQDVATIVFIALLLMVAGTVLVVAVRKQTGGFAP